jgi:hypothetical protein
MDAAACSNAYVHENGYLKIDLGRSESSGARMRLNLWRPDLENSENIHNHKWDYASLILCGVLSEEMYIPSSQGTELTRLRYESRLGKHEYSLVQNGQDCLQRYAVYQWSRGEIYHRQGSLLHRVRSAPDRLTASLQITYRPTGLDASDVYSRSIMAGDTLIVPSPSPNPAVVHETLRKLLVNVR